ncbi:MAG: hypothetical protein M1829_006498 [Trizodia sp. TS-e1964]|nr:MAG: hypothetical protein M1829_006498 [Trizodia sp. TS-e1964]
MARRPLHERSDNELPISIRLVQESSSSSAISKSRAKSKASSEPDPIYSTAPFPTLPAHILSPSSSFSNHLPPPSPAFRGLVCETGVSTWPSAFAPVADPAETTPALIPKECLPASPVSPTPATLLPSPTQIDSNIQTHFPPQTVKRRHRAPSAPTRESSSASQLADIYRSELGLYGDSPSHATTTSTIRPLALSPRGNAYTFVSPRLPAYANKSPGNVHTKNTLEDSSVVPQNQYRVSPAPLHLPESRKVRMSTAKASSQKQPRTTATPQASSQPPKSILKKSSSSSLQHGHPASRSPHLSNQSSPRLCATGILEHSSEPTLDLQYPQVKPPVARASWADSGITIPKRTRANERPSLRSQQWKTRLSTVVSEVDSKSPRSPPPIQSHSGQSQGQGHHAERLVGNELSVNMVNGLAKKYPIHVQKPSHRTWAPSSIAADPDLISHQPDTPRKRSSIVMSISSIGSRRATWSDDGSSQASFILHGLPEWARLYYSRGPSVLPGSPAQHATIVAPPAPNPIHNTNARLPSPVISSLTAGSTTSAPTNSPVSNEEFSWEIRRPKNRAHLDRELFGVGNRGGSMDIMPDSRDDDMGTWDFRPETSTPIPRTPRLHHDRRTWTESRNSIWVMPPALPEPKERLFDQRNIQRGLFCLGFILPFTWLLAAILPLPPPPLIARKGKHRLAGNVEEAVSDEDDISIQNSFYMNTRWWRNLNRIMSVLGLLVIGAIIALAILTARSRN